MILGGGPKYQTNTEYYAYSLRVGGIVCLFSGIIRSLLLLNPKHQARPIWAGFSVPILTVLSFRGSGAGVKN
jgi:hypothetical protein